MSAIPLSEVQYQQEHIHESRSELLIVVSTVICGLALLSFVLRLVARYAKGAPLGLDDWLSIGSAISLAGMAICVGLVAHYGIGKHLLLVLETPGRITEIGKTQLALTTLYVFAMTFGKLSVLALFARIFTLASRTFRLAIYFFVIVTILWFAANILTIYLQCRPLSTLWGDPHSCLTSEASGVVLGAVNAVADIGILILPQRMIWDLRLSLRRRVAVSGVFLVGGFGLTHHTKNMLLLAISIGFALQGTVLAARAESSLLDEQWLAGVQNQNDPLLSNEVRAARRACELAGALFSGDLLNVDGIPKYIPQDSHFYINRTRIPWSANCWQNAACVVSPHSSQDVSGLMAIITSTHATFSIRSGGHDFNVDHSSVGPNGILIDLSNLNDVSVSPDMKTVTTGPGALWGDVYRALNGTGVSVNGGRSPGVGVGGQTLGGGIGWFTNDAGVTAASLIAAKVVLANSSILRVDGTTHPDLLWALRGGGSNFGIVTSLTYKTLPHDKMWFAARLYTSDKNQQLLDALIEYERLSANSTKSSIVYSLSYTGTTAPGSFVGFLYLDPVEFPPVFEPFLKIEQALDMINSTIGTVAELTSYYRGKQYPDPGVPPMRHYVVSISHKVDDSTYQESFKDFVRVAKKALASGWRMTYGSQPITTTAVRKSANTPLGLVEIEQDCELFWSLWIPVFQGERSHPTSAEQCCTNFGEGVHVTISWTSPEDDTDAKKLIYDMGESIAQSSALQGAELAYRFMNDAHQGQPVFTGYGAKNMRLLMQISSEYDPEGVFQRLQNGGWLLSHEYEA
ncbi:hypothetical protein F5Y09DRAFT_352244 [Xylaria sp. FL1042]|nr:hypothetical protein F5Y09DRAFT_352244 [Xylaria sp. FL1042]